jgi:hypothetical protein
MNSELAAVQWPANVEPAIQTLIRDGGPVIGDLRQINNLNESAEASFQNKLSADASTEHADAVVVRGLLHLPTQTGS